MRDKTPPSPPLIEHENTQPPSPPIIEQMTESVGEEDSLPFTYRQNGDDPNIFEIYCEADSKHLGKISLGVEMMFSRKFVDNTELKQSNEDVFVYHYNGKRKSIIAENDACITWHSPPGESMTIIGDTSVCTIEYGYEKYLALKNEFYNREKEERLVIEKRQIAAKLKEKHRRKELEKLVRQELLDSGEIFDDQTKRPPITRNIADAVYSRDSGRCVYCGSMENLHFDHIIPFSKGGATNIENLQLLCQRCNLEKSNKIG